MYSDWKINISNEFSTLRSNIFIYRDRGDYREILDNKGKISKYKIEDDKGESTLVLDRDILDLLRKELLKEKEESLSELKATKYHLEDMRQLLKLTNNK